MKTAYWLPIVALAAFAGDCGDPSVFESDSDIGTEAYYEFIINSVNVTCSGSTVTADAMFQGWADTVTLDMANTGDGAYDATSGSTAGIYTETHVFPADANIAFEADGSSDTWQLVLPVVSDIGAQVDGENTFLNCAGFFDTDGSGDDASNTYDSTAFRFTATPDDSTQDAQCAIFGHESATVSGWGDCECFEAFLSPVPSNPCDAN